MLIVVIVLFLVTEIPAALIFIIHVLSVSLKSYVINYQLLNVLLIVRIFAKAAKSASRGKRYSLAKVRPNMCAKYER
ncbi:hypothetical protein ANCDUO_07832 [Ancylostoma duodenale]|uniref:G-protein coupled receptors family 1 profile domain-containing protein n=1 Tax=Ancylostoma duodenale TaxID=51022 RepID=A0A0C2GSA8_9BILA|nr:hypothetical protein ANCDUO_07832 [Ancylostoma duodenale]